MPSDRVPGDDPDIQYDLFTRLFHKGPAALAVTRLSDGRFVEVSNALLDLFGYAREEIIGSTSVELGVWADQGEREEAVKIALAGGSIEKELSLVTKTGEIRIVLASARVVEVAGEQYLGTVLVDVTDLKRTEESLRHLATRDELTNLYNRREMGLMLQAEIARARRYHHFLSLMILDLDHFKRVNDTYGHQMGDEVLRQVAKLLRETIRASDSAARYGGEEFAIIMPETTSSGAFKVGERIRQAVAAHLFTNPTAGMQLPIVRTTISIGIGCFPTDAESQDALIVAADRAMYQAKAEGRNRTVAFNTAFSTKPFTNHNSEE